MLGILHIFWKMTRKCHILGVIFYFVKKMVHPIVFLTSFLDSATRKTYKMIYWKLKYYKKISISSYSVRFWGKWACPTFRGYVQGGYWVQISKIDVDLLILL